MTKKLFNYVAYWLGVLILVNILLVNTSCKGLVGEDKHIESNMDTLYVTNFQEDIFWKDTYIEEVIQLETSVESFIGNVNSLSFKNGIFVVHDSWNHKLLAFDKNGRFMHQFGSRGRGPGEYRDLRGYDVVEAENELVILSYQEIFVYQLNNGSFLRREQLKLPPDLYNPYAIKKVTESSYALWNANINSQHPSNNQRSSIIILEQGKVTSSMIPLKDYVSISPIFWDSNNTIYIKPQPTSNTIYMLNDQSVTARFYIDFLKSGLPDSESLDPLKESDLTEFNQSEYYKSIMSFIEMQEYIYFTCIGPKAYLYEFLYNKNSHQTIGRIKKGFFPTIFQLDKEGWLVGIVDNQLLLTYLNNIQEYRDSFLDKIIDELDGHLELGNNPIIIKFKITP